MFGTHGLADLQRAQALSVIAYGENRTYQEIARLLEAHNRLWMDKFQTLCEVTTDTRRRYGGQDSMTMGDLDEYGTPDVQKISAGSNVDFPLYRKGRGLQWTLDYLEEVTPIELMAQMEAIQNADIQAADVELRKALFTPTNRTVIDRFDSQVTLGVKALVNADSAPIPVDVNGNTFNPATHTHYIARVGTFAASDIDALISTVLEHYTAPGVRAMVLINQAQEGTIRGFNAAGQFLAYPPPDLILGVNQNRPTGVLDPNNTFNRAIGTWGNANAQVWVKPWIPANYLLCYLQGGPKPLVMRIKNARTGSLRLVFEDEDHPLRAKGYARTYGFGTWNRTAAAVLYIGGTTYSAPSTYP